MVWRKSKFRWSLGLLVILFVFLLSACGNTDNFVDLNTGREDTSVETTTDPVDISTKEDVFAEEQKVFYNFLETVSFANTISYERSIVPAPTLTGEASDFFFPSTTQVHEKKSFYLLEYPDDYPIEQKIITDGEEAYWADFETKDAASLPVEDDDLRDSLLQLASMENLSLLSVGYETVDDKEYLAFSVSEGGRLANWYFDEEGLLFLRSYKDKDTSVAVLYEDLRFHELEDSFFQLSGFTVEDEVPPNALAALTVYQESDDSKDKEPEDEKKEDATEEGIKSDDKESLEEKETPEPTPVKVPEKAPESTTPPTGSGALQPPAPQKEDPLPPPATLPTKENSTSKAETSGESKKIITSDSSSAVIDAPPEDKKEDATKESESSTTLPKDYPKKDVPLPFGFELVSGKQENRSGVWAITVEGNYTGPPSAARGYYEELLENTDRYSSSETYDDAGGYTYSTCTGTINGWWVYATISESHRTNKTTIKILVEK